MADYLAIARRALIGEPKQPKGETASPGKGIAIAAEPGARSELGRLRDDWGFPLAPDEQIIDPATETPCPVCGSLVKWQSAAGQLRCQSCDPPTQARGLLEQLQNIRKREGIQTCRTHVAPIRPHCRRCFSTQFIDSKIHGGRSLRRDCAQCGLTAGFPMWWGRVDDQFGAT